jgi:BirA family transcriptional regulator, biotin operon repressor / biotin---[acetyl-CoA-carboxylase] ligase
MPQFDVSCILRDTFIRDVDYCTVVDSTNTRAIEWAKSGKAKTPLLVLAERQTAGRGRGTNRWWTGQRSLAFSLLVDEARLPESSAQFPLIALAAGMAVMGAVQPFLPDHRVSLRWPNDLYVGEQKLGGILVEISGGRFAIIGIGVNVNNSIRDAPVELQSTAVSMLDLTGNLVDSTELLTKIISKLEIELRCLRNVKELANIRPYCLPQNKSVQVRNKEGIIHGLCRGIESEGAILLETPEGMKSIQAWTVQPFPNP